MDKKAYVPSDAVEDYIDNFTAAALENLDYDIEPDQKFKDRLKKAIEGETKNDENKIGIQEIIKQA